MNPISLSQLNAKSELLKRIELKFLSTYKKLPDILGAFEQNYDLLEIDGHRAFTYNTIYFDTKEFIYYYDHLKGKRKRKKIRTRLYEESGLCFYEIKLKHRHYKVKKRLAIDTQKHGTLNLQQEKFFHEHHQTLYGYKDTNKLIPVIQTRHKRMTLVGKHVHERITLDYQLQYSDLRPQGTHQTIYDPHNLIIEVKSTKEHSLAKKILKQQGIKQIDTFSKYCIGANVLRMVKKGNTFKQTLKKVQ